MATLAEDRAAATFTETEPLKTAAPRDPFASSLIISGDSVTSSDQVAGLPLPTAAGPGQLAAIIFFSHGSADLDPRDRDVLSSEEHTSELQSLMRISYAVFCLKKKKNNTNT